MWSCPSSRGSSGRALTGSSNPRAMCVHVGCRAGDETLDRIVVEDQRRILRPETERVEVKPRLPGLDRGPVPNRFRDRVEGVNLAAEPLDQLEIERCVLTEAGEIADGVAIQDAVRQGPAAVLVSDPGRRCPAGAPSEPPAGAGDEQPLLADPADGPGKVPHRLQRLIPDD